MWAIISTLDWLKISWFLVVGLLMVIWSTFLIWRGWRQEYKNEEIFSFSLLLWMGAVLGGAMMWGIWGWGIVVGLVLMLWKWTRDNKWDFWEWADYLSVMVFWLWLAGGLAFGAIRGESLITAFLGIVILSIIKKTYRKLKWYKSGKMGLVFFSAILIFATAQVWVAILSPHKVYLGGLTASQWMGAWVAAGSVIGIYFRGKV